MNSSSVLRVAMATGLSLLAAGCQTAGTVRLTKAEYLDKCKGAWAGQMIGVCYGEPYQFQSNGRPITEPLREWKNDIIVGAIKQDDVYVEMTFLAALQKHGLDMTAQQAGEAFAATPYPLWHANYYARENIRHGILPPMSGSPAHNRHCDDIDFQIEADVFGVLCPGMPLESNRLCDAVGHIMGYGDGVYGGMFVAGMYTAAYFESRDVFKVIEAGLACIPPQSLYHQCITDTVRWAKQYPDNWLAAWKLIERKWNDDIDCTPGNPHNIDAKINGAYIVMGLIYGKGDLGKTIEYCTRCGQDADSSTANAGGIVGCMKGFNALGPQWTGGFDSLAGKKFLGTDYTFDDLTPACRQLTEAIIRRYGGSITEDAYVIPRQTPKAAALEQWTDKARMVTVPVPQSEVDLWSPGWKVVDVKSKFDGGYYPREYGRTNVLMIGPFTPLKAAGIETQITVPQTASPKLHIEAASDGQHGDYLLKAFIDNQQVADAVIRSSEFVDVTADVQVAAGTKVNVRLEFHANDWTVESAYIRKVEIR